MTYSPKPIYGHTRRPAFQSMAAARRFKMRSHSNGWRRIWSFDVDAVTRHVGDLRRAEERQAAERTAEIKALGLHLLGSDPAPLTPSQRKRLLENELLKAKAAGREDGLEAELLRTKLSQCREGTSAMIHRSRPDAARDREPSRYSPSSVIRRGIGHLCSLAFRAAPSLIRSACERAASALRSALPDRPFSFLRPSGRTGTIAEAGERASSPVKGGQ